MGCGRLRGALVLTAEKAFNLPSPRSKATPRGFFLVHSCLPKGGEELRPLQCLHLNRRLWLLPYLKGPENQNNTTTTEPIMWENFTFD